ncbi:prepilin-type N-terminal cleavage/methylation domain-containing protein [Paraferrimonas sp. SM1919]|uniref:prepilin-type N-terminal cleavage/methylation domain-containing protein n=1 Tax=Paraferrimonas sp. SM1919 TaxID=2662263 RepID=UPI0013D066E1|nr:prepilin-type N-terminal cleavage/methylation domain-containing protein [Paraferrimonas sp. SM1919]
MKGQSSGYTLIEVLITLVIMAVGLLGILTLHSHVKVATIENSQYQSAHILARDLLTRIQINPEASYVGTYSSVPTAPLLKCQQAMTLPSCTPEQLKQWQLYYWLRQLFGYHSLANNIPAPLLRQPVVCVTMDASLAIVVITWQSMESGLDTAANDVIANGCGSASDKRKFIKLTGVV